jgi:hypothetical protein
VLTDAAVEWAASQEQHLRGLNEGQSSGKGNLSIFSSHFQSVQTYNFAGAFLATLRMEERPFIPLIAGSECGSWFTARNAQSAPEERLSHSPLI